MPSYKLPFFTRTCAMQPCKKNSEKSQFIHSNIAQVWKHRSVDRDLLSECRAVYHMNDMIKAMPSLHYSPLGHQHIVVHNSSFSIDTIIIRKQNEYHSDSYSLPLSFAFVSVSVHCCLDGSADLLLFIPISRHLPPSSPPQGVFGL